MEKKNVLNLFFEGVQLLFKKWSAFRLALDNNPQILSQYDQFEDENGNFVEDLEINRMLNMLYNDLFDEIKKSKGTKSKQIVGNLLYCFIQEFFEVDLEDESEFELAGDILKLYDELNQNDLTFLDALRNKDKTFKYDYEISFPIDPLQNITNLKIKNKDDDDENDNDEEDEEDEDASMEIEENGPDEEGFVEVKKGKGYYNKINK